DEADNDRATVVIRVEEAPPPPPPAADLALTAIDAPEAATRGGGVEIRVTRSNAGDLDVEDVVTITLRDGADQVIGTAEVEGLAAGASVERVFAWDTKDAPLGEKIGRASCGDRVEDAVDDGASEESREEEEVPPQQPQAADLALTAIDAPEAAARGDVAGLEFRRALVRALDVEDVVTITLRDGADQVIGTAEVEGLAAGASVERVFAWDTKDAPLGENTLTASHDFSDDEADNNRATVVIRLEEEVPPPPPPAPPMHTFSDDFAGGALDGSRWEIVEGPERITV